MDHANAAREVLAAVGGKENIVSAAHCATRLRLVIADNAKLDKAKVEDCEGVKGVFEAAGQIQIIYGTGTVNKVFDEFVKISGVAAGSTSDVKQAAAAKGNIIQQATKALGDVFVPIIPAIVASGLLMGLTEGLNNAMGGALAMNGWWTLIHTFSNASFVFLQILIGFSAARVFGGNEFLGGVIGMIMNHTALMNAWSIPGALGHLVVGSDAAAQALGVSAAEASADAIMAAGYVPQVALLPGVDLLNVTLQGYQGHVIPVVVAVFLMCQIEKWLHKHVPDMLDLFVTPLVTVLVTGLATMIVIGPIFSLLEEYVMNFFKFLLGIPFGLGGALAGAIYPLTVVLGVHHMFNALEAGLVAQGADGFNPIISAANIAQGAACLAVFLKTRSEKKKGLALPSGLSSLLGITEPAIYGVNLPSLKPFIAAICGAAAGGAVSSFLGLYSTAYGITGIFGYLITANPVTYSIVFAVAFAVAFGIAFVLYKDEDVEAAKAAAPAADRAIEAGAAAAPGAAAAAAATDEDADAPAAKADAHKVYAPMTGSCIAMEEVDDPVFASCAMGGGVAIDPTEGKIVSPVDGTVTMLFDTKHAIGLMSDDGVEVLIHCGINTVELKGAPFDAKVKAGDKVKRGQVLMNVDLDQIRAAENCQTITPVIITNTDAYASLVAKHVGETVNAGNLVITLE